MLVVVFQTCVGLSGSNADRKSATSWWPRDPSRPPRRSWRSRRPCGARTASPRQSASSASSRSSHRRQMAPATKSTSARNAVSHFAAKTVSHLPFSKTLAQVRIHLFTDGRVPVWLYPRLVTKQANGDLEYCFAKHRIFHVKYL